MSRIHQTLRECFRNPSALYIGAMSALIGMTCALPAHPLRALAVGEGFVLWLWIRQFDSVGQRRGADRQAARWNPSTALITGSSPEEQRPGVVTVPALW